MKRIIVAPLMALVVCSFVACGGKSAPTADSPLNPNLTAVPTTAEESLNNLLYSKNYTGQISVRFEESEKIDYRNGKFSATSSELALFLNTFLAEHPLVSIVGESDGSRRRLVASQRRLQHSRRVKLNNNDASFEFQVSDPDEAKAFIAQLSAYKGKSVRYIDPHRRTYLPSTKAIPSDPLLTNQEYLDSKEAHHGVNVKEVWATFPDITGSNVTIFDSEAGWNFSHEDLSIQESDIISEESGGIISTPEQIAKQIQHGTGVVGILNGKWNNDGISGILPDVNVKLSKHETGIGLGFVYYKMFDGTTYLEPGVKEGDIVLIEKVITNAYNSPDETCSGSSLPSEVPTSNCVLVEAAIGVNKGIQDMVNLGVVVIEPAGNSHIDLDSKYGSTVFGESPPSYTLPENDSGAIVVGATMPNGEKHPLSNYGSRIDLHAWGNSVMTTGFFDFVNPPADPNAAYSDGFGGTSAASAIVAGVAAMVQSYTKTLYNDGATSVDPTYGTLLKKVYFDSRQMRQLLEETGTPSVNPDSYQLGKLPNAAAAIAAVKSGEYQPTIKLYLNDKLAQVWNSSEETHSDLYDPARGKKYDLDGDGRADLIRLEFNTWTVDLSTNNFGSDDLTFEFTDGFDLSTMVFPAVADYDGNGVADLAMYDSLNGLYYIRYTDSDLLAGNWSGGWSRIIDYTELAGAMPYMRPVPGYYNDDDWLDIAFQGPDGQWWIDYGNRTFPSKPEGWLPLLAGGDLKGGFSTESSVEDLLTDYLGVDNKLGAIGFDQVVNYLDYLDEAFGADVAAQLKGEIPGWAFLGVGVEYAGGITSIMYSLPDSDAIPDKSGVIIEDGYVNKMGSTDFYGNQNVIVPGDYEYSYYESDGIGNKNQQGGWTFNYSDVYLLSDTPTSTTPSTGFGNIQCRPIPADYDGDGIDDPATLCPNEWRIAYSGEEFASLESNGLHSFQFDFGSAWTLPAYVFPGGISYEDVVSTYTTYSPKLADWNDHFDRYQQPTEVKGEPTPLDKPKISEIWPNWCKNWQCDMATNGKPFPPAIGPHMAQCLEIWASNPIYCWDK